MSSTATQAPPDEPGQEPVTPDPGSAAAAPADAPTSAPTDAPTDEPAIEWPEQLQPYQEALGPLLEADEDGNTMLAGVLDLVDMAGNPDRIDDFASWWDQIGQEFGFFAGDGEEPDAQGGEQPESDDPVEQLRQQVQQLQQRLEGTDRQSAAERHAQQVDQEVDQLMSQHRIVNDESLPEAQRPRTMILRLAATYVNDPNTVDQAVQLGVQDYMRLTGQAQAGMLQRAGEETMGVEQLAGGGSPGPSLAGGSPDMDPEPVGSWKDAKQAAIRRLQSG